MSKGRFLRGEANPNSKLTEAEVGAILKSSESSRELAPRYRVSDGYVRALRRGRWWQWLGAR
jgi:hypothetical protein